MAKTQITTAAEAASLVKDGMTVMVGGFMANGTPEPIIDEVLAERKTKKPENGKEKQEVSASLWKMDR